MGCISYSTLATALGLISYFIASIPIVPLAVFIWYTKNVWYFFCFIFFTYYCILATTMTSVTARSPRPLSASTNDQRLSSSEASFSLKPRADDTSAWRQRQTFFAEYPEKFPESRFPSPNLQCCAVSSSHLHVEETFETALRFRKSSFQRKSLVIPAVSPPHAQGKHNICHLHWKCVRRAGEVNFSCALCCVLMWEVSETSTTAWVWLCTSAFCMNMRMRVRLEVCYCSMFAFVFVCVCVRSHGSNVGMRVLESEDVF